MPTTNPEGRLDLKASAWLDSFRAAEVTIVIGTARATIKLWP
jgi:hypothetical protein